MTRNLFDFKVETAPRPAVERNAAPVSRSYSRLNDATGWFVVFCAVATAVPIGLNRPVWWLGWVILTAVVAIGYFAIGARIAPERKLLSTRHPLLFGFSILVPIWALAQGLPGPGAWVRAVPDGFAPFGAVSVLPGASAMGALRFAGYILFAVLTIEVAGRSDRAIRMAWMIFWGVVAHAIWGLFALNMLGGANFWDGEASTDGVATGFFINRNSYATFLGMGGALGLALVLDRLHKPRMRRSRPQGPLSAERLETLLVWLALGVILAALLTTQSRMGVVATLLGALVCFVTMRLKAGTSAWRVVGTVASLGVLAVILAFLAFGDGTLERFVFIQGDSVSRTTGYALILDMIAARPLAGYGFDAFRPAFEWVHAPPMPGHLIWDRAHSTYLGNWAELGLLAGSVPILVGLLAIRRLRDVIRRRTQDYALSVAALAALTVGAVHSLVDFSLEMPANVILLLAILGLGLAHRAPLRRAPDGAGNS